MQKTLITFCYLVAAQLSFAQASAPKDIATIKSLRMASNIAIKKHDLAELSSYWCDDLVLVRGNSTHLSGKDTIAATWEKLFNDNPTVNYTRIPSKIIISTNDSLAWETGTWKAFNSYSKGGNYSAMWKKANDTWKIQAELFVSLF